MHLRKYLDCKTLNYHQSLRHQIHQSQSKSLMLSIEGDRTYIPCFNEARHALFEHSYKPSHNASALNILSGKQNG